MAHPRKGSVRFESGWNAVAVGTWRMWPILRVPAKGPSGVVEPPTAPDGPGPRQKLKFPRTYSRNGTFFPVWWSVTIPSWVRIVRTLSPR